jgi:hypothetical protein
VYTVEQTIEWLARGDVAELSLDYDLRDSDTESGLAVLRWIDQRIATDPDWEPPLRIAIHSDNENGRPLMIAALEDIRERLRSQGRPLVPPVF